MDDWGLADFRVGEHEEGARYVAFFVRDDAVPFGVVRVVGDTVESFTRKLVWTPSRLLDRLPQEPTWTARDVDVEYANDFLVRTAREVRAAWFRPVVAEYTYHAVFHQSRDLVDPDSAYMLVRQSNGTDEQRYLGNLRWGWTDKIYRLSSGRDWTEEDVTIGEAEAERLKGVLDERWDEACRFHVVKEGSRTVAAVRVQRTRSGEISEMSCADGESWTPADLLATAADEPTWSVEDVDRPSVAEHLAVLVRQHREGKPETFSAGYAVFRHPTGVLDLDSAHEVVREVDSAHETAVPIRHDEWDRLTVRILIRKAMADLRQTGDHVCFAVFGRRSDVVDLGLAYSVVRCAASGVGPWEVYYRDGEWLRTSRQQDQLLPIDAEGVGRLTRAIEDASGPRFFEVHDGGAVTLVRTSGAIEEAASDLGWTPSVLLQRSIVARTGSITELTASSAEISRFFRAQIPRSVKRGEEGFFAFFATMADALALTKAVALVRRNAGVEEEYVGAGEWRSTDRLSAPRGSGMLQELPLSPEEAEWVAADWDMANRRSSD